MMVAAPVRIGLGGMEENAVPPVFEEHTVHRSHAFDQGGGSSIRLIERLSATGAGAAHRSGSKGRSVVASDMADPIKSGPAGPQPAVTRFRSVRHRLRLRGRLVG